MSDVETLVPEEPFDAGDARSVKEHVRKAKVSAAGRTRLVRQIMSSVEGRVWIWEILSRCHIYSTSFSTNALSMAFQEGERNIGLMINAEVTAKPLYELYQQMVKENTDVD